MGCKPSRSRPGKRSQFPTGGKGRGAKEQWPVASERKAGEIVPHGSPPTPLAPVTLGANRASRPQRRWPRYVFDLEGSVNSAFLGLFSATFGPSFSGYGYPTRYAATTCCSRLDRCRQRELPVSRTFLDQFRPQLSGHGYPTQRAANTSCPRSDRFWLLELRVSRTFLDKLRFICSDHGCPTQCAANTSVFARGVSAV